MSEVEDFPKGVGRVVVSITLPPLLNQAYDMALSDINVRRAAEGRRKATKGQMLGQGGLELVPEAKAYWRMLEALEQVARTDTNSGKTTTIRD